MRDKRATHGVSREPVVPVQTQPFGLAELRFVRDAIGAFAPDWTAELVGICVDEATLVVVPENGDDGTGASFVISRDTFGYRLDRIHWDQMNELGSYSTLSDVTAAIRACVRTREALSEGMPLTLH